MRVRWLEEAERQADAAAAYIAQGRPLVALRWLERLVDATERVGDFPESGRVVPSINNPLVREIVFEDVRVIYRIDPAEIVVLIVWHTRRDPRKLERHLRVYRSPS